MGHTYDKLDLLQREKVWELKAKGQSGTEVAKALAAGFPRDDPPVARVKITPQAVNQLYRRQRLERDALYSQRLAFVTTEDALYLLRRKLSLIANSEADRLMKLQERGKLDADQLRRLAGACERIEKLELTAASRPRTEGAKPPKAPSVPDDQEQDKAPSFADQMLADAAEREAEIGSGPGEPPVQAVPADLQAEGHQGT